MQCIRGSGRPIADINMDPDVDGGGAVIIFHVITPLTPKGWRLFW